MIVHGTCHHDCPDSCGWTVTVEDGVAVKLRGRVDHPYSAGELCPKVNRFLDRVYSPDRVLHPLRRSRPEGRGPFERISWDDALAEIAARLHGVDRRPRGEAVLPFSDAGNQSLLAMMGLSERFFHAPRREPAGAGDLRPDRRPRRAHDERQRARRSIRSSCATAS